MSEVTKPRRYQLVVKVVTVRFIYTVPQLPHATSAALSSQTAGVQPSLRSRTFSCSLTAVLSPSLTFNGLHVHNPDYSFTDSGGIESH